MRAAPRSTPGPPCGELEAGKGLDDHDFGVDDRPHVVHDDVDPAGRQQPPRTVAQCGDAAVRERAVDHHVNPAGARRRQQGARLLRQMLEGLSHSTLQSVTSVV